MIDSTTETLVSFPEACQRHLPRRRAGRRMHPATLYRWAADGLRGVTLETIQVGGARCTSVQALGRFFAELTHRAKVGSRGSRQDPLPGKEEIPAGSLSRSAGRGSPSIDDERF